MAYISSRGEVFYGMNFSLLNLSLIYLKSISNLVTSDLFL